MTFNVINLSKVGSEGDMRTCNLLLSQAFANGSQAVLLTTSQTHISEAAAERLRETGQKYPDAILCGRLVDAHMPVRIQLPGWRWSAEHFDWRPLWYLEIKSEPAESLLSTDSLSPEAMLIPQQVWLAIGVFDTRLSLPLAVVDWCLRARRAGFQCYEVPSARIPKLIVPDTPSIPWVTAHLSSFPGMLLLASKHHVPARIVRMAWSILHKAVGEETRRVRYWADYGRQISHFKRSIWYARNVLVAIKRARLFSVISILARHLLLSTAHRHLP
jgi:GT2 family glycosyltransferase